MNTRRLAITSGLSGASPTSDLLGNGLRRISERRITAESAFVLHNVSDTFGNVGSPEAPGFKTARVFGRPTVVRKVTLGPLQSLPIDPTGSGLSLFGQSIQPGDPSTHNILNFFRRQAPVPIRTSNQQHVFGCCRCSHVCLLKDSNHVQQSGRTRMRCFMSIERMRMREKDISFKTIGLFLPDGFPDSWEIPAGPTGFVFTGIPTTRFSGLMVGEAFLPISGSIPSPVPRLSLSVPAKCIGGTKSRALPDR